MENMSSEPAPQEIAVAHAAEILGAVAKEFELPVDELTLLPDQTFVEHSDNSLSFFVRHKTGMYGVNAECNTDGTLHNFTTANLQMPEYFNPSSADKNQ